MAMAFSPRSITPIIIPSSDPNPSAPDPSPSIDFGNPDSLSEIRSLTDVGTMTHLLHECVAYQRSLDLRLESLLSTRTDLDRHLSSLSRSSHLLDLARSEASHLLLSLQSASSLADSVSRKVRSLDLAQSRALSALSRADAILRRSHLLDLCRRSLSSDDLESAADSIRSFLEIDAQFPDPSSDHRDQLLHLKRDLESTIRKRLSAAIDQRDHPSILRYVRIFPPLGLQEEGLQTYVSYLKKVIALRSRLEFEHLAELAEQAPPQSNQLNFVGCITNLFKDIVLAVEENDEILRSLCGEDGIVYAILELQDECDSRGTQILKKYMDHRKLARLASEINSYSKNLLSVGVLEGPDPREVEMYLEEILSLTQLGEDYTEFMISKIRGLASVDPKLGPRATKAFRSGSFSRMVQDLTGFYVILEEFFMVENVRKAIKIDEHVPDSLTTSMVDDVFYVLQSCCRRAISTTSINSVFAVLSGAMNLLSNEYQEALQQKMRELNLGAKLFLGGVGVQKTGTDLSTALNNMDVSTEYVLKLKHEIEEQCAEAFPAPADREKLKSCLSELGEISSSFKQILNAGLEQLVVTVTPRIRPVLDSVGTISYELTDAEYEENEMNDPWVQKLLHAVETNIVWLQSAMTSNNYDSLVHLIIDFIVKRLEVIMMQKKFSQLGGLQLDREVRALVNHFSEMTQRPVRDKFARLSQMTTILNFERVSEILDFWGENAGHMTWLLTPAEVRRVLGLRTDFKAEAIAALRL
ncbi:conserved oligomeric Golgi complex subunit 4 [Dioscorea cayenensis subsp. rotundata]|uniref:Conserved oligomeric Golgi complex subunit 4 n=1 Tax=Dioscorea cayennensis subsp. rotundata TaxID=55577 RepID=A0AB40B5B8_DIOCR|nr:conserved oligomeric Golgi complex subunit 4 [Dioscorea cayenensis subsp. rotundata]